MTTGRLRAAVHRRRVQSMCVTLIGLHLAAVAVVFPTSLGPPLRAALLVCAAIGPPLLLLSVASARPLTRLILLGPVGLGATLAGLAGSVPHAVMAGPDRGDFTGILATGAGIVLIGSAFREALRGRRFTVRLAVGALGAFVIAQWLIVPAVNVGVVTNAPRPSAAAAATLGLPGARDVGFQAADGIRLVCARE